MGWRVSFYRPLRTPSNVRRYITSASTVLRVFHDFFLNSNLLSDKITEEAVTMQYFGPIRVEWVECLYQKKLTHMLDVQLNVW